MIISPPFSTFSARPFKINHSHSEIFFFDFLEIYNELGKVIFFCTVLLDLGVVNADFPLRGRFRPPLRLTELTLQEAASGMHPKWQGGGQILPPL